MSTSEKPPPDVDRMFDDDEAPTESDHAQPREHEGQHSHHPEQQYYEDEQHYDENGQPYSEEEQYDENGQPYAVEEQQYDEHGQPYAVEEPYDAATETIDAYPTTPTFTGPPAPMSNRGAPYSRRPLGPPASQGGPYRVPIAPEPATIPLAFKPAGVPVPHPFLGSALATYGVLLWSFVVAGQFATSWITGAPMSNGTAIVIVFSATIAAWILALRRARTAAPAPSLAKGVSRGVGTLAAAAFMFFVTLIIATICGQVSSRNHDFAIAFFLVVTAVAATIMGPRLTMPTRPQRTHGARFALVSMWIVGAIVTFIAGAELATNG